MDLKQMHLKTDDALHQTLDAVWIANVMRLRIEGRSRNDRIAQLDQGDA